MSDKKTQTRRMERPSFAEIASEEPPAHSAPTLAPPDMGDLERTTERQLAVPASDASQRAVLTVLTGVNAGQVFSVDADEMFIGRGSEVGIWVEDPGVSRKHARIYRKDGLYWIEDLASTNGTFIRREPVTSSMLVSGDRIQLGPNMVLTFALIDDVEENLRHRLYEASTRDSLTRAFNRQFLVERLQSEMAHARRHKTKLAILMLDLDAFKNLNDTHGHLAGDYVLRSVAAQLARLIRAEDVLARYGGEEFVILARSTGKTQASRLAERVRSAVEKLPLELHDETVFVTVSIGVAAISELAPEASEDDLLRLADTRLYAAKHRGRNCVVAE